MDCFAKIIIITIGLTPFDNLSILIIIFTYMLSIWFNKKTPNFLNWEFLSAYTYSLISDYCIDSITL